MPRWFSALVVPLSLGVASSALALPPGEQGRGFREGANHHVGDDSFVLAMGHAPGSRDGERERMHVHLAYVRGWLGARSATRPELSARRAELLSYLDEYIAHGTTPANTHLPWRNPVFIDDSGTICAVGYLIERSSGRAVAERIAEAHRYDYLEDIATSMPEVKRWIDESGFTLEELASIQPGYLMPGVETYKPWDLEKNKLPDGPYEEANNEGATRGTIKGGRMEGTWTRALPGNVIVGRGDLSHGAGTWRSTYADGNLMAEGRYARNHPSGIWRFYHPSGNLAAVGSFDLGIRNGTWQFFQDKKQQVPIATGGFDHGMTAGVWRHFDTEGHLLATSRDQTPAQWNDWGTRRAGHLLDIVAGPSGIHHWVHEGNQRGDGQRLDLLSKNGTQLYVLHAELVYDPDGHRLSRSDSGAWISSDCHWSAARKAAAHAGDIVTLHGLLLHEYYESDDRCKSPQPVSDARGKRIDAMLAEVRDVRSESPEMVTKIVLGEETVDEAAEREANPADMINGHTQSPKDLAKLLATSMTWYVEFPHVDRRFTEVFQTMAGYGPVEP
jgi:hypothetical protein